jgi:hypothetical protein
MRCLRLPAHLEFKGSGLLIDRGRQSLVFQLRRAPRGRISPSAKAPPDYALDLTAQWLLAQAEARCGLFVG